MTSNTRERTNLEKLLKKGVSVPRPESVDIGSDIDPERISGEGVTLHPGCKIYGAKTLIMSGAELGYEAPVTVHNCELGQNVSLRGGFFCESCFLEGVSLGSGAHIREACLLEERSRGGHTVGLKHTILFPFVTLGSLINFCDCLMAGGTDERNHSEVGSSYIHFNYTPNQDKATASLIGDVSRGVMINQPPVFLGGQGGLIGPLRIGYGTVVGAGAIVRKEILDENTLFFGHPAPYKSIPFRLGLYTNIKRLITLNTVYISNLIALRRWYLDVRSRFMKDKTMEEDLLRGAVDKIEKAINERLEKLGEVANRMPQSIELYKRVVSDRASKRIIQKKQEFFERWPELEQIFKDSLKRGTDSPQKDAFFDIIENGIGEKGKNYLDVIRGLNETEAKVGTVWLQGLVNEVSSRVFAMLPSIRPDVKV